MMNETDGSPPTEPIERELETKERPAADRFDRRFKIDGDANEALRVVVAGRSDDEIRK